MCVRGARGSVNAENLADLIPHADSGVERSARVLGNVRHQGATQRSDVAFGTSDQLGASDPNRAALDPQSGPRVSEHRLGQRRLSASRLPHKS